MQTIIIIFKFIMASITGRRFYVLLVLPDKRGVYSGVHDMSGALIHDAMHATLDRMIETGQVRRDFSEDERGEFNIPEDV